MSSSDPSVIAIVIKLICVAASIVIGSIMALESQRNAVQRRDLLLVAAKDGRPRSFLKHTCAYTLNLIFLWLLQFAVFTLATMLAGFELEHLLQSQLYILAVTIVSLPLLVFAIAGRPLHIRRPASHS